MSMEKTIFAAIIVLALTLNAGFVMGDIEHISHHNPYELFAALVVSLIATLMKFGDRTRLGSTMLATSLVADLQLIAAAGAWTMYGFGTQDLDAAASVTIVSLAGGALIANIVSVVLLIAETASLRR